MRHGHFFSSSHSSEYHPEKIKNIYYTPTTVKKTKILCSFEIDHFEKWRLLLATWNFFYIKKYTFQIQH